MVKPEVLRAILRYEPETGRLYWRHRSREYFASDWSYKVWNMRYPEEEAFTTNSRGYLSGRIFNKGYLAHRVCFAMYHGYWPTGEIDHVDGNPSNNLIENLREVTSSENSMNMKRHSHNTSGVNGVYFEGFTNRWVASAEKGGKRVKKRFPTKEGAIKHRDELSLELGFHENHGRYTIRD